MPQEEGSNNAKSRERLRLFLALVLAGGLVITDLVKVRDAAARMRCQNNLRQLGVTIDAYYDTHKHFPRAGMNSPVSLPPVRRLSWLVALGPYLEATNLYVRMEREKAWDAEENRYLALATYPILQCPAQPDTLSVSTLFPTTYTGIAGLGPDALTLPLGSDRAGYFGYERLLTRSAIQRGASSLFVVVETGQVHGAWTAAGPPTVRWVEEEAQACRGPGAAFGGTHREGANALFADGSVRFLRDTLDPALVRAAASVMTSRSAAWSGEGD